ncbi:MAG: serine/threonine-protein kinase [Akkermansiaceae bacterium]|nr:serine/threonine-protein kinase [Akkermansiaceae bacterium]
MSEDLFEAPSLEYLGAHLPQYGFEDFVAQGGMGAVYKARQISLDRTVAIKVLPKELGENEEFRESFSKEAKAMARLNHINLIAVFDSGDVDGMPYIAMEYIEGCSLHDAAYGEKLDPTEAATIVKGICDGLAHANEHGIVHRDIKPANILLNDKKIPKIGDFGLAHPSDSDELGLIMGTPGYTAPEVFDDPNLAGPVADIYSVGMILHQLLTGIDPAGTQAPPTQASGRIRLDAIWRKATQVNPEDRYSSAQEMSDALDAWLASKSGSLVKASPGGALAPGRQAFRPTMMSSNSSSGGGGAIIKLLILALLAAAAFLGYQKYQEGQSGKAPEGPNPGESPMPGMNGDSQSVGNESKSNPDSEGNPSRPKKGKPKDKGKGKQARSNSEMFQPRKPTREENNDELPPGDLELRNQAIELILKARDKRDEQLSKNTKSFQRLLDAEAATAAKSQAEIYIQLRRKCDDGRIPEPGATGSLESKVSRAYQDARREQMDIDAEYFAELTNIRDHYVPKLERKLKSTSDPKMKELLKGQIERADFVAEWALHLAPER